MPLTNAGRDFIAQAIVGSGTVFNNTNARIGVGDGVAAFDSMQTDLQGANKFRKEMDSGYPQVAGNQITFKATFAGDEANFPWQEWGIFNAASGGTMLNRLVEYNGTKLAGQTWIFQTTLTIQIGT